MPAWALAGSAALHLAVVTLPGLLSTAHSDAGVAAGEARRTAVRWISERSDAVAPSSPAGVGPAWLPEAPSAEASTRRGTAPAAVADTSRSPDLSPAIVATEESPAAPTAAPAPGVMAAAVAAVDAVDGYLPRKALSVPPAPREPIALAWPAGMAVIGRQAAVFTVFIDETGVVRRMVPDGPTLQPTLEATARDTFSAAAFSPGQLDGRPVKAMIRIEVVFDASVPVASAPRAPAPAMVSSQNL